jgi:hypothetical protein
LWNRLRYLWPFAPGFIMGAMCLAYLAGELAARVRVRFRLLSLVLAGCVVGGLATHFNWVREDVAMSASGIDRQQATLGRWAKEHLPANARIGVNDTGAIAYFSDRTTFDIVGLTTPSEAHYWVGGTASRFEHYERMHATAPESLPNFFIVYPQWLGCDSILGPMLNEAVVTDANILGGQAMRVHVANWALLGTGEAPWTNVGKIVDVLDVADLESEKEHDYSLEGAHDGEETVLESSAPDGHPVVDGGRTRRSREHFFAKLTPGKESAALVRVRGDATTKLEIFSQGEKLADVTFADSEWIEAPFRIPAKLASAHTEIELRATEGTVDTFHYYFGAD